MIVTLPEVAFLCCLVFCRVGGCLSLLPVFGSSRIPMKIRLLIAVAISLSVTPLLLEQIYADVRIVNGSKAILLVATECFTGFGLGLMSRCFVLAVQFAAAMIASLIGLAGIPGVGIEDNDMSSPLSSLMSMSATMMLLASGAHIEMLKAVIASYTIMPIASTWDIGRLTASLLRAVADTSLLALRLAGPFIMYSVLISFAIGLVGKFTPQLQIYFISTGVIMIGGLLLLIPLAPEWLALFSNTYHSWIEEVLL